MLRASPAQWFEIVVASENATETMELLARRGQIQFEWTGEPSAATRLEWLHGPLKRYRALAAVALRLLAVAGVREAQLHADGGGRRRGRDPTA